MKKDKLIKYLILIFFVIGTIVILNITRTVKILINYEIPKNEVDLYYQANIIALGTVCNKLTDDVVVKDTDYIYYTISPFEIDRLIKGEVTDKIVNIIQPIGVIRENYIFKMKYTYGGYTEMKRTSKYILYLKEASPGKYSIIGLDHGKFNIDNTDKKELEFTKKNVQFRQLKDQVLIRFKNSLFKKT